MTKEQEESLKKLKRQIIAEKYTKNIGIPVYISDLKNVLSMLEEKDKIIDLMAEKIYEEGIVWDNKEEVKQYYERKVENGN